MQSLSNASDPLPHLFATCSALPIVKSCACNSGLRRTALCRNESPGSYDSSDNDNVDLILATHNHADHFDPIAVGRHLRANPEARFVSTKQAVKSLRDRVEDFEAIADDLTNISTMDATDGEVADDTVIGTSGQTKTDIKMEGAASIEMQSKAAGVGGGGVDIGNDATTVDFTGKHIYTRTRSIDAADVEAAGG